MHCEQYRIFVMISRGQDFKQLRSTKTKFKFFIMYYFTMIEPVLFEVNGFVSMVFWNFSSRGEGDYLRFRIYNIYLVIISLSQRYSHTSIYRPPIYRFPPIRRALFPSSKLANCRVCDFSPQDISSHETFHSILIPIITATQTLILTLALTIILLRQLTVLRQKGVRGIILKYIVRSPNCTLNRGMTVFGYIP